MSRLTTIVAIFGILSLTLGGGVAVSTAQSSGNITVSGQAYVGGQVCLGVTGIPDNVDNQVWDVDGDGIGEFVEQNTSYTFNQSGNQTVVFQYTINETTTTLNKTIYVSNLRPAVIAPNDPDCDGLFEDVNGDTETDILDVVNLYDMLETVAKPSQFDFNDDGQINILDVVRLSNEVA